MNSDINQVLKVKRLRLQIHRFCNSHGETHDKCVYLLKFGSSSSVLFFFSNMNLLILTLSPGSSCHKLNPCQGRQAVIVKSGDNMESSYFRERRCSLRLSRPDQTSGTLRRLMICYEPRWLRIQCSFKISKQTRVYHLFRRQTMDQLEETRKR